LISASTSLVASCRRRRRAVGVASKSSVSVTSWTPKSRAASVQKKPAASGAVAIA
jgi:hypothetical protein